MEIPQTLRLAMLLCVLAIAGVWYAQEHRFDLMLRATNGQKGLVVTGFVALHRDTVSEARANEAEQELPPQKRPIKEQTEF